VPTIRLFLFLKKKHHSFPFAFLRERDRERQKIGELHFSSGPQANETCTVHVACIAGRPTSSVVLCSSKRLLTTSLTSGKVIPSPPPFFAYPSNVRRWTGTESTGRYGDLMKKTGSPPASNPTMDDEPGANRVRVADESRPESRRGAGAGRSATPTRMCG